MGKLAALIETKLQSALAPITLEVIDDSASHAGHVGNPGGDRESHFHVNIVSEAFTGQSRVSRQRMVNKALAEELKGPIHALSMTTRAPDEA
ncbi:BolA family transcriptional regulator [Kordiimonas sediminis]|uniref:BolA family transcriptional regulator n=1 Tax=Kordiimonas sediminis TaxID=1735581 RepID=A0A919ALJ9_9PROT|nr:BolA family protein [Kordiimonas sediminis]GHF14532.1 BolA family transcriptional regulator [Kordiimonas sediminis]